MKDRRTGTLDGSGTVRRQSGAPGRRTLTAALGGQRRAAVRGQGLPTMDDAATSTVSAKRGGGPVDPGIRTLMEGQLGIDLGGVRVHSDDNAQDGAAQIEARAFTHGQDVFLGAGETGTDLRLMAHELTHVAQQSEHPRRITVGAQDHPAEREADQVADRVAAGHPASEARIVEDGAMPLDGQLSRTAFLALLRDATIATTTAMLGPTWASDDCAYIQRWFTQHAGTPAATLERIVQRFSGLAHVASAAEYIPAITARLRSGIGRWRMGEDVSGEIAAAGIEPAELGAPAVPVAGGVPGGGAVAQAKGADTPSIEPGSPADVAGQLGAGERLDPVVASRAADAYGDDFSGVRVHTGATAARLASERGAHAFTVGADVAFAAGAYQPNTPHGDALLAHELAHVVQQRGQPAAVQRKRSDGQAGDAYEHEADRAASGFLARAYGGVKTAVQRIALRASPTMQLSTCSGGPTPVPVPADPYLARLHAKLHATPRDLAGFYADIQVDALGHAGNATTRAGFETFITDGVLSRAESMRAVALQEIGPEASWPEAVKNFTTGVERGTFAITSLPPSGTDALREMCILRAGQTAEGAADLQANYRNTFDARWDSARFAAFATVFDESLSSKGPRNQRARHIFDELYADPAIRAAYDGNTPAGFRELCDTHAAPDNVNLIASPRIQELRALLTPPVVTVPGTADPLYQGLSATVRAKAVALDNRDRQEIERSHPWRMAVDAKVAGTTAAATQEVRDDLWGVITTSRPAGPAGAPPPGPGPALPAPVPNPAQTAFLAGITLGAPASPQVANTDDHALPFQVRAPGPGNPGLAVRRRVVVTPAAQVNTGGIGENEWASGATSADHTATVNPEFTGPVDAEHPVAGSTIFTAKLTMPPLAAATFPEKTAAVTVQDHRLEWFRTAIRPGAVFTNDTRRTELKAGDVIHYHGGQMPMIVAPELGEANPGLDIDMEGEITNPAGVVFAMPRKKFGRRAMSESLGHTILLEPAPPPAAPVDHTVTIRFLQGAAPVKTLTVPFKIGHSVAPAGGDAAMIDADNKWLNTAIGTAGGLLHHMDTAYGAGSIEQRVARAVAAGAFTLKACTVRSDSRTVVVGAGKDPGEQVAYALGAIDASPGPLPNTLIAGPGADWYRVGGGVYLITRDSTHTGPRKPLAALAQGLKHEGIHAVDRELPAAVAGDDWPDYVAEFRSYWVEGRGAALSTAVDPTMDNRGPKSARSRDIFEFLYTDMNATYPFVKEDYDSNANGFRDKVNNYVYPDGINLILSGKLTALRTEIDSFSGLPADYPAKKAAIQAKFAALVPGTDDAELREIRGNRDWRDLVESKFPVAANRTEIKGILGIPT